MGAKTMTINRYKLRGKNKRCDSGEVAQGITVQIYSIQVIVVNNVNVGTESKYAIVALAEKDIGGDD